MLKVILAVMIGYIVAFFVFAYTFANSGFVTMEIIWALHFVAVYIGIALLYRQQKRNNQNEKIESLMEEISKLRKLIEEEN